jgi:hypothetical protein
MSAPNPEVLRTAWESYLKAQEALKLARDSLELAAGGTLFVVGEQVVWYPWRDWEVRCVAVTSKKQRCRNYVIDEQFYSPHNRPFIDVREFSKPGYWETHLPEQTCKVHQGRVSGSWGYDRVIIPDSQPLVRALF